MAATAILADTVFDGEGLRSGAAVVVADGRIVEVTGQADLGPVACVTLPPGSILAPGFIDVQVNGGGGVLFNDQPTGAGLAAIASAHRGFGTTGLLPTLISDSRDAVRRAIRSVAEAIDHRVPGILGIHLEGPFLNVARKGAHPAAHIVVAEDSDIDLLSSLGSRGITLVTLAPECVPPGFIAELTRRGIVVCAGHTEATAAQVLAAVEEGLKGVTHLYNAMSQLGPREPGTVGAALSCPALFAGIIADGHHVADLSLKLAWKAKGADRLMLVTDAMSPVGTAASAFSLFGRTIRVGEGRCTTEDGTLAGAILDMAGAVRFMVGRVGVPLEEALAMASTTPARFLGLAPERGCLVPGAVADMVALAPDLTASQTWIAGVPSGARAAA